MKSKTLTLSYLKKFKKVAKIKDKRFEWNLAQLQYWFEEYVCLSFNCPAYSKLDLCVP